MSFAVWSTKPTFAEADLSPGERIYQLGEHWVVTNQEKPTQSEVDAVLNSPPPAKRIANGDLAAVLIAKGILKQEDVDSVAGVL